MNKKASIWISTLLMVASIFTWGTSDVKAYANTQSSVEYTFQNESELNDFTAVYVDAEDDVNGTVGEISDYFTIDTAFGKVTSKRQNTQSTGSTGSITSLILNKYTFTNFQAEIEMDFEGDSSWGWGGLQFRKTALISGWRANGCFTFVQREGKATIWGSDAFDNTTIEGTTPNDFPETDPFLLTVRVVGKECNVMVSNTSKTTVYSELTYTFTKKDSVMDGYVALQSVDNSHNFYSLKITNLDENGNEKPLQLNTSANKIVLDETLTSVKVGEPTMISYEANGDLDKGALIWSVSDSDIAVVNGGWITGLKQGTVTIQVSSATVPTIKDSITLTVGAADSNAYMFDNETDIQTLTPAFVSFKSDPNGGDEDFDAHWEKTGTGTIQRINLPSSDASDENFAYLYEPSKLYSNFQATLIYRNTNAGLGWIGIASGTLAYNQRTIDQGLSCFVQKEGFPTTWGGDIALYEEKMDLYGVAEWHALRVRVYNGIIEMYIDDMDTAVLTRNCKKDFAQGFVGIMTTGQAQFEIAALTISPLSKEGEIVDSASIQSITISPKVSTANVGDKRTLSIQGEGNGITNLEYTFVTSDDNVAFVVDGVLHFISAGEVTVTVYCPYDTRLTDSFTITVEKRAKSEKDYYYPGDGCGGVLNPSAICVGVLFLAMGIGIKRRWR